MEGGGRRGINGRPVEPLIFHSLDFGFCYSDPLLEPEWRLWEAYFYTFKISWEDWRGEGMHGRLQLNSRLEARLGQKEIDTVAEFRSKSMLLYGGVGKASEQGHSL